MSIVRKNLYRVKSTIGEHHVVADSFIDAVEAWECRPGPWPNSMLIAISLVDGSTIVDEPIREVSEIDARRFRVLSAKKDRWGSAMRYATIKPHFYKIDANGRKIATYDWLTELADSLLEAEAPP